MGYKFRPDQSYLMPTNFGPANSFDVFHYTELYTFGISYTTDKDAIAALLPEILEPGDQPWVRVTCQTCRGVSFLAGGGYNLVSITVPVTFDGEQDHISGVYCIAIWESNTICCILGRELWGVGKLYADIPDPWINGQNRSFYASENGTKLFHAKIENLRESGNTAGPARPQVTPINLLGWKFIPKPNGKGSDLSAACLIPISTITEETLVGEGSIDFNETNWDMAPVSAHIVNGLRTLPVREYLPAFVTKGSQDLLVFEARTLR